MKTMLNLSILLMLIAGSAGAIDFHKMYSTGEISTLYDKKPIPAAHKVAYKETAPVVAATTLPEPPPDLADMELDAKYFSRSEEIYIAEEEIEDTEPVVVAEEATQPDSVTVDPLPVSIAAPEIYQVAAEDYSIEEARQQPADTVAGDK
jgi:hypothetical protein